MRNSTCSVPECGGEHWARGYCCKHYQQRHTHERTRRASCQVEGCTTRVRSMVSGLCEKHYYRQRRHGDVLTILDTRRDDAGYRAAHRRISVDRGQAREFPCIDCGVQAQHWSYRHDDPDERVSDRGQPYSLDPGHYDPRCASCHMIFDGVGANQYSPA